MSAQSIVSRVALPASGMKQVQHIKSMLRRAALRIERIQNHLKSVRVLLASSVEALDDEM
jgi:hypothetical protein